MPIEFKSSVGPSLGVEVELEIVDPATGELASAATDMLGELGAPHGEHGHPKAKHELFECTVEIITGICQTVSEARADLEGTLGEVRAAADRRGLALMCSGTHPFSSWRDQRISPNPRYERLLQEMAWMGQRLQIFGIHYHVGVRSPAKVVAIANALSSYIPHFLAVSASSPFWGGHDTGLASSRSKVFEGLPTAGLPEPIESWEDFEQFMDTLVSAEAIGTIREVWWDIRPHPDFGTVELRMCDGIPTLHEVAAVAALAQSMVDWLDSLIDRGYTLPIPREWILRQNKWRAARHGLDADLIIDATGRRQPMREAVGDLLDELAPTARRLGCADELAGVRDILEGGSSYLRRRRVVAQGGALTDVVDALVKELATDTPSDTGRLANAAMHTDELDYDLPEDRIAQVPIEPRDAARLLVDRGPRSEPKHRVVRDLPEWLQPGDVLVVNDTRVRAARLRLQKPTGGAVEVLLLEPTAGGEWEALVRPSRRVPAGSVFDAPGGRVIVGADLGNGRRVVTIEGHVEGEVPLPPYVHTALKDPERYQTVYARHPGSAAAPTAGLHLTLDLLDACRARGVTVATVDLAVGLDTFRPMTSARVEDHAIHSEAYAVPAATMAACRAARRVVAVGTTVVRALESAAATGELEGRTSLFIRRGYTFVLVDRMLTNFHVPRSTLLALVDAFVGPRWRELYQLGLATGYRFLSFGDAMLLTRS